MSELLINFSDPIQKAKMLTHVRTLDGPHRVTIVKQRKRRSDAQNNYMWGVVIPNVAAGLLEAWGEHLSDYQVHEFLKKQFLSEPVINRNTGEVQGETLRASSAALNTAEFVEYIEKIARFAAQALGVVIPEPTMFPEETEDHSESVGDRRRVGAIPTPRS